MCYSFRRSFGQTAGFCLSSNTSNGACHIVVVHGIAVTLRITSFSIGATTSRSEFISVFREINQHDDSTKKANVLSVGQVTVLSSD